MLTAQKLSKRYHTFREVEAVQDISLELPAGKFLSVIGRSGSGKSTLLGMIGGLIRPSSGTVCINGVDVWSLPGDDLAAFRNRSIGFVFQFPSLLPTLRAVDNVALPALIGKTCNSASAYARAQSLLRRVGLGEQLDAYPGELSGGEQRRVALARSLMNSPQLLLADEPTGDLDEETEQEILALLLDIYKTDGLALIIVTHNLAIAQRADQVTELHQGRAVANEIHKRPQLESVFPPTPSVRLRQGVSLPLGEATVPAAPEAPVRLGEGLERFIARFFLWAGMIVLALGTSNWAVGRYQRYLIERQLKAASALEELAMADLRADIEDISFGPGNTYRLTLYLRNVTGTRPIYVMTPQVRAYVQVGTNWQEVPLHSSDDNEGQVLKIEGKQTYSYTFAPDVQNFEQLIPYYMHVRFSNTMIVSPQSQPKKDELVERTDNYYTYLKPHEADDAAILRQLKFPRKPPLWIPMPPH